MIIASDPPENALFIDSRSPGEYMQGHLEGALNVDLSSSRMRLRSEEELSQLERALADLNGRIGASPGRPVVVYDNGFNTRLSKTAFMLALGGLEVHLWPGGWESQATSTTPAQPTPTQPWGQLKRDILLTADEVLGEKTLVDVRNPDEFAASRIPGAKNIPLDRFFQPGGVEAMGFQQGEEVGLHCRSGARSASAFWILRDKGIKAKNYLSSMLEWEAEGDLPVERGKEG